MYLSALDVTYNGFQNRMRKNAEKHSP